MSAVRPRRSVLYMPGSNARALHKARTLAADGLILEAILVDLDLHQLEAVHHHIQLGSLGGRHAPLPHVHDGLEFVGLGLEELALFRGEHRNSGLPVYLGCRGAP